MRYVRLFISLLLLFSFVFVLNRSLEIGSTSLPPMGKLLNPFSGFWQNAPSANLKNNELELAGLKEEVLIKYDERGVPHVFAKNMEDLLFAQGYIIAKERLWQLDITTRAIEGKTAEVLGKRSLEQDLGSRRRGLARAARLADETWKKNKEGYLLLNKFSEGINAYIDNLNTKDYPLEFKLLDYQPQQWSPFRTALFIKAMAITLNARHTDIAATNALNLFGKEEFYDLYPDRNAKQSPIVTKEEWFEPSFSFKENVTETIGMLFPTESRTEKEVFVGSNNFAVGGDKTLSGVPILANDPHLKLTLPSIWMEMHLVCPEMNAYGVSLPGMPGITLGFNEYISWGQTNSGHDVLDLYEIEWVDEDRTKYFLDGEEMNTEIVVEEVKVRNSSSIKDTVLYTVWGPVRKENGEQTNLAQRWISSDAPNPEEIEIYLDINKAKNFEEFKVALSHFNTPAQNFIFSSVSGDIAMSVTGELPIKSDQQGRFIQDGSTSASSWKGFIPRNELPEEVNPQRNFVSSANQHPADTNYPYYYNGGFEDFRGRYINRRLEEMNEVTVEDLMNLQLDAHSLKAEEALPLLLSVMGDSEWSAKEESILEELRSWDYVYTETTKAGTYFNLWWSSFYDTTFDEILEARKEKDVLYVEEFRLIEMMETGHPIFDLSETEQVEDFSDIAKLSFRSLGLDSLDVKPWSENRSTIIGHATNIPAFASEAIKSGGHPNAPNAISKSAGPSWRMVVEMSQPVRAYGIFPGGTSGNPGSVFYDNFVEDWQEGNYYELNHSKNPEDITALTTHKISVKK